jgi:hypothetical protein
MDLKQKQINAKPVRHAVYSGIIKKDKKLKLNVFNRILIVLLILAGISSVLCVNDLAVKGFVLRELKIELAGLNRINEANELAAMKLESFENINARAKELKMVKADFIDYIVISEGSFAKK